MPREAPSVSIEMRDAWRELRSEYAVNKTSRFRPAARGVAAMGSGADYHYANEADYLRGIEWARNQDRNNMVIAQAVDRLCDNIWSDGFSLDPTTPDKGLNKALREQIYAWADDPTLCDLEGERTLWEMAWLTLRHTVVDGDIVHSLTKEGSIQTFENQRLRTPAGKRGGLIVHGVEMTDTAKRLRYWITKEDVGVYRPLFNAGQSQPFDAFASDEYGEFRQVLHCYDPRRFSQRRGVTAFAPMADCLGIHDDLQFAQLVKAQVAACYALIENVAETVTPPSAEASSEALGNRTEVSREDGTTAIQERVYPGMRVRGRPGVTLTGFSPNVPNQEFFQHTRLILTFIANNLGLPYHVLLLDPSETNFSGWRGAIDEARKGFKRRQQWLISRFLAPAYFWKVRQLATADPAIGRKLVKYGKLAFSHAWRPPTWRYIEPAKDATADVIRLRNHLISPRRRSAEQGFDNDELQTEIVADNGGLIEKAHLEAERLKKKYPGLDCTWRDVAMLSPPEGVTLSVNANDPQQQAAADSKPTPAKA